MRASTLPAATATAAAAATLLLLAAIAPLPLAEACCEPGDAAPVCDFAACAVGTNGNQACVNTYVVRPGDYEFDPSGTIYGTCNIFGCHCDVCYTDYVCNADYQSCGPNCQSIAYYNNGRRRRRLQGLEAVAEEAVHALKAKKGKGKAGNTSHAITPGQDCEDLPAIVNATIPELIARLTPVFCKKDDDKDVGPAFAQATQDIMDSNVDGTITCGEWKIAKRTATLADLPAGAHYGRASLPPPACKLSLSGAKVWAETNKHLAELRAAGLKAGNETVVEATVESAVANAKAKPADLWSLAKDVVGQVTNKTAALVAELKE